MPKTKPAFQELPVDPAEICKPVSRFFEFYGCGDDEALVSVSAYVSSLPTREQAAEFFLRKTGCEPHRIQIRRTNMVGSRGLLPVLEADWTYHATDEEG